MAGTIASRQQKSNAICYETWVRQDQLSHQTRLKKIRSHVDTKAPPIYGHLIQRAKKEQMDEERYTRIEHENRLLLKKMSKIMRTSSMDNLQKPMKVERTLNAGVRKQELRRIMQENQAILKRIQSRKSFYHRDDFDRHALLHESYRSNIQEKQSRILPTLAKDPRAKSAPERGRTKMLEPIPKKNTKRSPKNKSSPKAAKAASPKPAKAAASPAKEAKAAPKKEKTKKESKDKKSKLSKGGFNIGGRYLIVTVEEHKVSGNHFIKFMAYDTDTEENMNLEVDFATIKKCVPAPLLGKGKREQLSDAIVQRVKMIDDKLSFDDSADWRPTSKHAQSGDTKEATAAAAAETQLSLKLKLASALEAETALSFHLFIGDNLISKTEEQSVTDGEKEFTSGFDLQASGSEKLQLRLLKADGSNSATLDFTLDDLTDGEACELPMSDANFTAVVTMTAAADVSINVDE